MVNPEEFIRQSAKTPDAHGEAWVLKAVRSLSGKQAISLRTKLAKKGTLNSLPKSIVGELHMSAAPMDSPPGIPKHDVVGISREEFNTLAQKLGVG